MYFDLCNSKTFDSVRDALIEFWASGEVLAYAFDVNWRNEETFDDICYYYGFDTDEILKSAWIDTEDEEDEENED